MITTSVGALDYQENDGLVVIDGQATLTDADTTDFGGGKFLARLSVGATANDRLAIRNEGSGTGQIGVSGTDVTYGGVTIGSFSGGVGSTALQVTLDNDATVLATEALLRNITYLNDSENPSTADRTVEFVVEDSVGVGSVPATKVVKVSAVNDAPVVVVNTGATVPQGSSLVITTLMFQATDVDNSVSDLVFELTALPVGGVLQLSGTTLVSGGTFTQANIDGNALAYVHNGGDVTSDSFELQLTDGSGGVVSGVTFSLVVNELPVITTSVGALDYQENDGLVV
ncbi:MAG: cadherin-like domain-containing protein, partial [Rubripirellula sp.]